MTTGNASRRTRTHAHQGLSLVETLIALTVLGVGLLGISVAQIHAIAGGQGGRHTSHAASLAESELERLRRVTWSDPDLVPTGTWSAGTVVENVVQGPNDEIEQVYTLSRRVTDLDPGNTRTVDVRVTWSENNRNRRSVFSSIRYNHEGL